MIARTQPRLILALVMLGGLLLAGSAVVLTIRLGDAVSPLFRQVLTIQVIVGLVVWSLLAWAARRLMVGKAENLSVASIPTFMWGGFRVALLIAAVTAIVCWLAALALGRETATVFVRALVLILVVNAFTGIIGGAFYNSILVVRRMRQRLTQ